MLDAEEREVALVAWRDTALADVKEKHGVRGSFAPPPSLLPTIFLRWPWSIPLLLFHDTNLCAITCAQTIVLRSC